MLIIFLIICGAFCGIFCGCSLFSRDKERTLLIYLCGSNLESEKGYATISLSEMCSADLPENVKVVIQTGGSKYWKNSEISNTEIGRYEIKDHSLVKVDTLPLDNMGEKDTLLDFLNFAKEKYPCDSTSLIFWDHGGGSLNGVCFDENFGYDSLTLSEIDQAFSEAKYEKKLDFVGFDACLMATLDTANVVSNYADYMIASQEIEPSGGWDYSSLLESFSHYDNTESLCKKICDSYLEKCKFSQKGNLATLSVFDLSENDNVNLAFDKFSKGLIENSDEKYGNFTLLTAVDNSVKFGGNSISEGYSNIIDLYGLALSLKNNIPDAVNLCSSLEKMIVYKTNGNDRKNSFGVSVYYPYVFEEDKLDEYLTNCDFSSYRNFLTDLYTDIPKETIKFVDRGSEAKDGSFQISLSPDSKKYVKSVDFFLVEFQPDKDEEFGVRANGLGIDNDIFKDWDNMKFHSNFRGIWLALDGKTLSYSITECNKEGIIFSSPVIVNGKRTNLRFSFTNDENGGYYKVIGLWDGIDKNGMSSKEITPLKEGDKVTILGRKIDVSDYGLSFIERDTITIGKDSGVISELPLSQTFYQYAYAVTDIFNNVFYSDIAIFEMQYSYKDLLENPLPDGKYAGKIIMIENGKDNEEVYNTLN
ncbi:MAG: clostripain-related cysteine peptidase [Oscillospiraceae bacterium]|nr:clostripain-related cysteine peptidase [Oscillospiraceae bacterium]